MTARRTGAIRHGGGARENPLSRERILLAALDLVDREGAGALTMRRLGAHLGVEAMSLYHHVASKQLLLDGLAEILVRGIPASYPAGGWDDALRLFAGSIRQVALAHPAAYQLVGMRPLTSIAALAPVAALLRRLAESGMTPEAAVAAYRVTVAYARGQSLAELVGPTLASRVDGEAGLDLEGFWPALETDPSAVFGRGLEILIAGIARDAFAAGPAA